MARQAKRARIELVIVVPLIGAFLLANEYREQIFGLDLPVRVVTAIALVILGWRLARDVGRSLAPLLFKRMDPATAGPVGFLIRLAFLITAVLMALRIAGLDPRTLAVSGAIFAVVFGLAAQQTLGNLIAGVVLHLRAAVPGRRPGAAAVGPASRASSRASWRASGCSTPTFTRGADSIMVPNNVVLAAAVVPLREPAAVDLRARLRPDIVPERGPGAARRAHPHAGAGRRRTSASRRSTRTRSSCGSRRRPRSDSDGAPARRRDPRGDRAGHARGRRRRSDWPRVADDVARGNAPR